jgi:hypothetical protein
METHARFQADGIHLLLDFAEVSGDGVFLSRAEQAAGYLVGLADPLDDRSLWFVHDSVEAGRETRDDYIYPVVASTAFGKSPRNTLCLNTHASTLCAVARLADLRAGSSHSRVGSTPVAGSPCAPCFQTDAGPWPWAEVVERGARATMKVLAARPAEPLYRCLGWLFRRYWFERRRGIADRAILHALAHVVLPRMPAIKARWPRLVMPDGYIDRDLTLGTTVWSYHLGNLYDLLSVYPFVPDPLLLETIGAAAQFCRTTPFLSFLAGIRDPVVPYLLDSAMMLSRTPRAMAPAEVAALARRILDWGYYPTAAAAGADACVTPPALQHVAFDPRRGDLLALRLGETDACAARFLLLNLSDRELSLTDRVSVTALEVEGGDASDRQGGSPRIAPRPAGSDVHLPPGGQMCVSIPLAAGARRALIEA